MSNKDYYGNPQQQYYPPAGTVFSYNVVTVMSLTVVFVQVHRKVRVGTTLSSLSRPIKATAVNLATNHSLRPKRSTCTLDLPSMCWSTNCCSLSCSQQPPQQKNDDFCMACLTGVCLCCCAEGEWPLRFMRIWDCHTRGQNFARAYSDLCECVASPSSLP